MANNKWSEKDIECLKKFYPDKSNKVIARDFNRSVFAVENKAYSLGLKKSDEYKSSMVNIMMPKEIIYVTQTFYIIPSKMNFI